MKDGWKLCKYRSLNSINHWLAELGMEIPASESAIDSEYDSESDNQSVGEGGNKDYSKG